MLVSNLLQWTPLAFAIEKEDVEVVTILIEKGADLNRKFQGNSLLSVFVVRPLWDI